MGRCRAIASDAENTAGVFKLIVPKQFARQKAHRGPSAQGAFFYCPVIHAQNTDKAVHDKTSGFLKSHKLGRDTFPGLTRPQGLLPLR